MADLNKFLANAAQGWEETVKKAKESSFENPADGSYIVQLSQAELAESKKGNVQIVWGFTILEGDLAGTQKRDYMRLDGDRALEPFAWRLQSMGIRLEDIDLTNLEGFLESLVEDKLIMKITLKTPPNSDFQQLRINTMLPDYDPSEASLGGDGYDSTELSGETEADEPENVDLQPGMKIRYKDGKKTPVATVDEVNEEFGTVDIKNSKGETVSVKFDDIIEVVEEGTDA